MTRGWDGKGTDGLVEGFDPVWDSGCVLLILGSFPSVKSRETNFYYGNRRNRFWGILSGFFGEDVPDDIDGKKEYLLRHRIALWDIVTRCHISGSQDASIKDAETADIGKIMEGSCINRIFLNGKKAAALFAARYPSAPAETVCLPSTSPANVGFSEDAWYAALADVFPENARAAKKDGQ